jgi:hypothetical protein
LLSYNNIYLNKFSAYKILISIIALTTNTKLKKAILLTMLWLLHLTSLAQKKNDSYQIHINKTLLPITIDGAMNEETWQQCEVAKDFFMVLPMDTGTARVRTEVRVTYDDKNFYLIATCYNAVAGPYYVESLRRDFAFGKNDNFLLFIDPFDDRTNGFSFGANAAGAQWDGTMFGGGSVDLNWDNKWISFVKNDPEKWVFEMAIPFTSIRYKKGILKWGINFSRLDLKTTEKSSWAPVPRQFPTASLAYTGNLIWDKAPPDQGANISVIPYVLGGISKNYENANPTTFQKKLGTDIKIGVTSALNLDLTVNPDFSQVEVDRQVTNLDRFELFFPERRQFFLENGDLFANFGYPTIRPFFSRRIGLGVPIRAGARLSGRLNKDWRIGVMDMQTAKVKETNLPGQNFAILSLQRRVFSRSNIGFLLVNKESVNYFPERDTTKPVYSKYNRNIGIEYNLASSNNQLTGKAFVLKSITPGRTGREMVQAAHLQYSKRRLNVLIQEEYVGKNYNAEVGYVPRNGYFKINPAGGPLFFPKKGKILSHGPRISATYFFDEAFKTTDHQNILFYTLNFRKQSVFTTGVLDEYVQLLRPFDPTNAGKDTLARGTKHYWKTWRTEFVSKPQSVFTYAFNTAYGGYYTNGTRLNLAGEIGYRFQPYVKFLLTANYNELSLPQPWNKTTFWLVGSQLDITMTNKIFFSTFLQYNQQTKNINLNTRFQWRYQPASDLFIVYTDNYLPAPFSVRNRALVLKLTYWWNKN